MIVAPIFPTISKEFGWTPDNEALFLGLAQTAPLIGNALANFFGFLGKDMKPSRVVFFTKFTYLAALSLTLINNTYILIAGRFVMGLSLGFQFPPSISIMYQVTPPSMRGMVGGIFSIMYSFGLMTGLGVGSLVSAETITWRVLYLMVISFAGIDFLIQLFYLKNDLSPIYLLKKEAGKDKFMNILGHFLTSKALDRKYEESKTAHAHAVKSQNKNKDGSEEEKKKPGFCSLYKKELLYGIKYSIIVNLCLFNMIATYQFFMITEDIDDKDEASFSGIMLTIAGAVELIFKFVGTYFGWTEKRKRGLTIGMLIMALTVAVNGYLQSQDHWAASKYTVNLLFLSVGVFVATSYFASLPEKFPQPVIGIV